jgi:hypothetical protein
LRYKALTGLTDGQLRMLALLVGKKIGAVARPGGKPPVIGLFDSAVMVVVADLGYVGSTASISYRSSACKDKISTIPRVSSINT